MKALSIRIGLLLTAFCLVARGAPANDNFVNATTLSGTTAYRIDSNVGATYEFNEPDHDGYPAYASIWYRWTAPQDGLATISTAGSNFDTILAVYRGSTLGTVSYVTSNDEDGTLSTSAVKFVAYAGVTYRIAVDGYFGDMGTVRLSLNLRTDLPKPTNDFYADATPLAGGFIDLTSANYFATMEPGELTPTLDGGTSVWWIWEAPTDERYLITTTDSNFDTILSVYNGTSLVAWNDDAEDHTSAVHVNTKKGTRYAISIQGYDGDMGDIRLQIYPDPPKPAPTWHLVDMDGNTRYSTEFAGQVVILDFWATWCGPCVEEVPDLIAMQQAYGADGLTIIGVSVDSDGFNSVIPFAIDHNVNYLEMLSTARIEADYGGIPLIPSTFIIDRDNNIVEHFVGNRSRADFESIILPLLYPVVSVNLAFSVEGGNLVLSWPTAAPGYSLESATDLSTASNWGADGATIGVENDQNVARVPLSAAKRFYRLTHN